MSQELIREVIEKANSSEPRVCFFRRAEKGIKVSGQRLGVFASSFDPLTKAHLEIIERGEERVDEILLLVDKKNADKETSNASLEDRIFMLWRFIENWNKVSLGLSSRPLFLEKLKALKKLYPPETKFCFLVGYDTIIRILDKKYYSNREAALRELFGESEFLVASRSGKGKEALASLFEKGENRQFKGKVGFLEISDFASSLSSTRVREKLQKGENVEALVPRRIFELIKELKLYGG